MELWIRSQDKRILAKVDNVYLNANYDNKVICYEHSGEDADLGHYATKERAIEVLDEIQNILKPKIVIKFDNKPKYLEDGTINDVLTPREEIDYSKQLSTYVYEMPLE